MATARQRVLVLINPRSGLGLSTAALFNAFERYWAHPEFILTYQFSRTVEDGKDKVRRALREGTDTVVVVGGDGMVNTIGSVVMGTGAALGVVPAGSGNGFARHFNIPLNITRAVETLARAHRMTIDVGTANDHPFFVTCSMAGDASLVRYFQKSPVRGIVPYVFAAAYELFEYKPQRFELMLDGREELSIEDVMVFTVANLTQFGGGARIAPKALADDGLLEMVALPRSAAGNILEGVPRLFNGTIDRLPGIVTRRFHRLDVHRRLPSVIQVDGEVVEATADVVVRVRRKALNVLVPKPT